MILYRDKQTIMLDSSGCWVENVKYLFKLWKSNQNNEALFLRLSTTCWYSLALDHIEVSLIDFQREEISKILKICFDFFQLTFSESSTCQWIFGYMMEVRPDLFFVCKLDYKRAEEMGRSFIQKSILQDNALAKLLDNEKHPLNKFSKRRKKIKKYISECFDESTNVDKYFSEILTSSIV